MGNILLNEYKYKQQINISKIICNDCKKNNKGNSHNNNFHRYNECKMIYEFHVKISIIKSTIVLIMKKKLYLWYS